MKLYPDHIQTIRFLMTRDSRLGAVIGLILWIPLLYRLVSYECERQYYYFYLGLCI